MSRLFGIETEYGISVQDQPEADPVTRSIELIKSYHSEDFRPMWDYKGEDPFQDERGFRAQRLQEQKKFAKTQVILSSFTKIILISLAIVMVATIII